jgi:hypothetical protein
MTYFRAIRTIMGPKCLTAVFGMGTGVATWVWSPASRGRVRGDLTVVVYQKGSGSSCISVCAPCRNAGICIGLIAPHVKELINAVKRLAVSTGKLRPLLTLHIRPIDPVVFREPMYRSTGNVILRRVSRLYAFSVYPGRT